MNQMFLSTQGSQLLVNPPGNHQFLQVCLLLKWEPIPTYVHFLQMPVLYKFVVWQNLKYSSVTDYESA